VRYRRIYAKANKDRSVSVLSVGPIGSLGIRLWGVVGTFILATIAFCFINPFPRETQAFFWWDVSWGLVVAVADLVWRISKRQQAKRLVGESRTTEDAG
jgi:hypothetical protein